MKQKFIGVGTALITPFTDNLEVDYDALKNLVNYQIDNGVDYLVVLGTTAETATLTSEEKNNIIDTICATNNKRVPLVLGMGANDTQALVNQIKTFNRFNDFDAILSVTPYYNKPSQQGIFLHYQTIAKVSPVPVIIYNVPGRTGVNITAATTLKIASEIENVIAIKEASGNMNQVMQIIKNKPDDFMVISGDDALTYPILTVGGVGVISVISNAFPKTFSNMVRHANHGEYSKAKELHYQLLDIANEIFVEGNPTGIKAILHHNNRIKNNLRLPLVHATTTHSQKLAELTHIFNNMA